MQSMAQESIELLIEAKALAFGEFTLKNGVKSPFFINLGQICRAAHMHKLGELMARAIMQNFPQCNVIFGPAYKGISLAAMAVAGLHAQGRDCAMCYDRKEAKDHGEGGNYIGAEPGEQDNLLMIDDVVSSGGTKVLAMQRLHARFGVRPQGILVIVDRRTANADTDFVHPPLYSLANILDLAEYLDNLDSPQAQLIRDFYRGA